MIALLGLLVISLDQLTKWWAMRALADEPIPVFWTLRFNLARNSGTAFSFGAGTGWSRWLPLLAMCVVVYLVWRGHMVMGRLGAVAVGLILGGAIGNLLDRLFRDTDAGFFQGRVVDFIDFGWWPVFNVADSGVVVGGILLVLCGMRAPDDSDDSDESDRPDESESRENADKAPSSDAVES